MPDDTDTYSEAHLTPEQVGEIDRVADQRRDALADLGAAYTQHQRAYEVFSETLRERTECERRAGVAEQQHNALMTTLAQAMGLPPGEWDYDKDSGTLKRRT